METLRLPHQVKKARNQGGPSILPTAKKHPNSYGMPSGSSSSDEDDLAIYEGGEVQESEDAEMELPPEDNRSLSPASEGDADLGNGDPEIASPSEESQEPRRSQHTANCQEAS
ncbi:UNVERIFIED_CONTAM: hypothetical protein FKN15_003375 [Acipenser sinensis]